MKTGHCSRALSGFNFLDLLIVLVTVAVIAVCVLAWLSTPVKRTKRINCLSNLKQVGLAYLMWANDNENKFPMAVSTDKGGSLEYNESGQVFRHYQALSSELNSPKVLACFNDTNRSRLTNWLAGFSDQNVSYFVGLDAEQGNPQMILSGDRNVTGGAATNGKVMLFSSNSPAAWTREIHVTFGNIGLADGSAQEVSAKGLRKQLQFITNGPIRLAIP